MKNNFKDRYDLNYKVNPNDNCVKYVKAFNDKKFNDYLYDDPCVKSDYCDSLISVIFNSNNIESSYNCIEKFIKKSKHPDKLQFCIKIDNDNDKFVDEFLKKLSPLKTNLLILSSPKGRGYIDLWQWVNFLFKVSSKKSYFVMNISDEMTVNENNWDVKLNKYKFYEKDELFRLRTSVYKNRNYSNIEECGYAPDTTAIYTKKYLLIQEDFSPCFGPDNGQQFVSFYLSKLNYPRHYQFSRDYVINDISFGGQGTNMGLSEEKLYERQLINYLLWCNMFKLKFQEEYFLRARKIQLEIIKKNSHIAKLIHKQYSKVFIVIFKSKKTYYRDRDNKIYLSYKINKIKYFIQGFKNIDFFKFQTSYDMPLLVGIIWHILLKYLKIHPKKITSHIKRDNKKSLIYNKLKNIWNFLNKKTYISDKLNFILPIKYMLLALKFLDIKGFVLFCIYYTFYLFFIFVSLVLKPQMIIFIIDDLYKRRTLSYLITSNSIDQSKTIMLKGD